MLDQVNVAVGSGAGHDAVSGDRRRAGRRDRVSPELLGLLRAADCLADGAAIDVNDRFVDDGEIGPPRHPKGVLIQIGICAVLWGGIIGGWRMFF